MRNEILEKLEQIQYNIVETERRVNQKEEDTVYYKFFGKRNEFKLDQDIQIKCLAYWKRRFNRELNKIKY